MAQSKREKEHDPQDDHGETVEPHREIPTEKGWLVCPDNAGEYTGDNVPWRR